MYRLKLRERTKEFIQGRDSYEAETIEQEIERMLNNGEEMGAEKELIYTERKDGVNAAHDIRTNRWDVAIGLQDKVNRSITAKRDEIDKAAEEKEDGKAEPVQATN